MRRVTVRRRAPDSHFLSPTPYYRDTPFIEHANRRYTPYNVEWQTGSAYRVNARSSPRPENSSRREHHSDVPPLTGALASPFAYAHDTTNGVSATRALRAITPVAHERVDDVGGQRRARTPEQRRLSSTSISRTADTEAEGASDVTATPPDLPTDVHHDVRPNVHRSIGSDIRREVGSDVHRNVGSDVHRNVGSDVHRDVEIEVPRVVKTFLHHNIEDIARRDVEASICKNAGDNVVPNVDTDGLSNVETGVPHDGTEDVKQANIAVPHIGPSNVQPNGAAEPRGHVTVLVRDDGGANIASNLENDPPHVHRTHVHRAAPPPSIQAYHGSQDIHGGGGPDDLPSYAANPPASRDLLANTNAYHNGFAHPYHHSVGPHPPYNPPPETRPYARYDDSLDVRPHSGASAHPHGGESVHYHGAPHREHEQADVFSKVSANRLRNLGISVEYFICPIILRNKCLNDQDDVRRNGPQDDRQNVVQDVGLNIHVAGGFAIAHAQDKRVNGFPSVLGVVPLAASPGGPSRLSDQHDEGVALADHMEDLDDVPDDSELDADPDADPDLDLDPDLDGPRAAGRISNDNKQILRDAFEQMYEKIKEVSAITGQAKSQVLDQFFSATHTRVHLKNNLWNIYSAYFVANMEQEIALLPNAELVLQEAPFRNSRIVRKACYDAFKRRHGAKASTILNKFRSLEEMDEGQDQTVAQRRMEFRKKHAKLQEMMDSFQAIYGFSGVYALLGNVANSDAGLAEVYETQDALGFFKSICRTDKNGVLSHFKAHVYNKVSLDNVALAHGDKDPVSPDASGSLPQKAGVGRKQVAKSSNTQAAKGRSSKAKNHDADIDGDGGSDNDNGANALKSKKTAKPTDDDDNGSDDDDIAIIKDRPKYIIKRFRRMLSMLNAGHIISESMFPWKKLLRNFAEGGVVIRNWPEEIPLPPLPKGAKPLTKSDAKPYSRGIAGMPSALQEIFIHALRDPDFPLHFERYSGPESDLLRSRVPVINGAPPASTSQYKVGRRVFVNGTVDREGVPRLTDALESDQKKTGSGKLKSKGERESSSTEKVATSAPKAGPAPASSSYDTRSRTSLSTSRRRHVEVVIPTTPNKRPPRGPPSPSEVHAVESSASSEDEYIPSDSAARPPQGTKRKARHASITLLSSDSGSDSLPAAPFSQRPAANQKGKARADDVGRRTPTPPPSKPHPKSDISEPCPQHPTPASPLRGAVDAHKAKQRRLDLESTATRDAQPSTTHMIPARGLNVPQGSSSGPSVVTYVGGDQHAMDVDDASRRPSTASIGAEPSQQGYIPQPSDAQLQGDNMPYDRNPSGAGPPPLVTRSTNGGGADNLGQGIAAAHAQLRRDPGELTQGVHGQGAMFHDEEHAAVLPPPNAVYGHYNPGNQYPYGYHYADAAPARYPPGMYPPGPYPYQPSNMYSYPGPAGYSGGFVQQPPPRGDPRYMPSQQGVAHPTSPVMYHPPAPGYSNVPPAGAVHRPPAPSSPSWRGPPRHAQMGPAPTPPLGMATPGQPPNAGPGDVGTREPRGMARVP
ncbi:hypothetical protein TRAPUB_10741 [Trametes pubescens]|uniref:Uncharacterized protein n=1 Tax=Trametes pubescens TaxID=154538 RepID=A0A1M2VYS1_TRAPU|nr:hypothetical protein TRAPUB_10741 [Trametes pubescens]